MARACILLVGIFLVLVTVGLSESATDHQSAEKQPAVGLEPSASLKIPSIINAENLSFDVLAKVLSSDNKKQQSPDSAQQQGPSGALCPITNAFQNFWARVKSTAQSVLPSRAMQMFQNLNNQVDLKSRYEAFKQFMQSYHRNYDVSELPRRFNNFMSRLTDIEQSVREFKEGKSTYMLGVNDLIDKDEGELAMLVGKKTPENTNEPDAETNEIDNDEQYKAWTKSSEGKKLQISASAPSSIDWRTSGCMGRVRNQGGCGACFIFSTLQTIESQLCLRNGTKLELSVQNVVDCIQGRGCYGGLERYVISHVNKRGYMALESCYPYKGREYYCPYRRASGCSVASSIDGTGGPIKMKKITGAYSIMQALGTIGPLAGGLYAPDKLFQYTTGIYDGKDCPRGRYQNHAVVLAGYGEENGVKYWLMKNSWGDTWGENGYVKVKRGNNECSVEQEAFIIYNKPTYDYHYV